MSDNPWSELYAESDAQLRQFAHARRMDKVRAGLGALAAFALVGMILYWLFT